MKLHVILNTVVTESMSDFQKSMLAVQKRDAANELARGQCRPELIGSVDLELNEFELQYDEAHRR